MTSLQTVPSLSSFPSETLTLVTRLRGRVSFVEEFPRQGILPAAAQRGSSRLQPLSAPGGGSPVTHVAALGPLRRMPARQLPHPRWRAWLCGFVRIFQNKSFSILNRRERAARTRALRLFSERALLARNEERAPLPPLRARRPAQPRERTNERTGTVPAPNATGPRLPPSCGRATAAAFQYAALRACARGTRPCNCDDLGQLATCEPFCPAGSGSRDRNRPVGNRRLRSSPESRRVPHRALRSQSRLLPVLTGPLLSPGPLA